MINQSAVSSSQRHLRDILSERKRGKIPNFSLKKIH